MKRTSSFFLVSLLLGFLFSLAALFPHYLQRMDRSYPFRGVEIMPTDAEAHYAARVREIYDGYWSAANVFYSDPKDQPYLQPPLPELAIAIPSLLFGIDPITAFVLAKAIFAFAVTLILIGFFASITGARWPSLLAVTTFLFAGVLIGAPWNAWANVLGTNPHGYPFLLFSRPVNPQWTVLWFASSLWAITVWWRSRSVLAMGFAALCGVVLLYSYFYAWTYLLAFVGILGLWCLWQRDRQRFFHLLLFFGIFVVLGMPYFLHVRQAAAHPLFAESARRIGLINRHTPLFGWWMVIFVAIGIGSKWRWCHSWPLVFLLALAGFIALNQHVITGMYIVPHHYHWYFIAPLASMFLLVLLFSIPRLYIPSRFLPILTAFFLIATVCFGFVEQARAYRDIRTTWGNNQALAPVLKYLRANKNVPKVAYASDIWLMDLIPVYTSLDVYTATNANNYLVSAVRARDVYFFELWLSGLTPQEAKQRFPTALRWHLGSRIHAIYYRELAGDYGRMSDNEVSQLIEDYRAYYVSSLQQKLSLYPLDLFIATPEDPKTKELAAVKAQGKEIWEQNGFTIFSMQ